LRQYRLELPSWRGRPLTTIYFGGGTPSLLPPRFYQSLLAVLAGDFNLEAVTEVTLEANPATLTTAGIRDFLALGINRFSLGVQTFADAGLRLLGRRHTAADSRETVARLRRGGVSNLSLDLIYAYPGQTPAGLRADLEAVTALEPEHISAYCLSLEPGTPLARRVERGEITALSPEKQALFMTEVIAGLTAKGYEHYEVANFARPGYQAHHNLAYWQLRDYWGLGAGAWSSRRLGTDRQRWACRQVWENDVGRYLRRFGPGDPRPLPPPAVVDLIPFESSLAERFIMGLRLRRGIDLDVVAAEYGRQPVADLLERLADFLAAGLLARRGTFLRLTDRGLLLADEIALHLLP